MADQPSLESMSASQLKEELTTMYGVPNAQQFLELSELRKAVGEARDTQPITYGMRFGKLMQIGNTTNPTGLVTLSHGLGDSAHGWADVAYEFAQSLPHLLFLLPTAPMSPVTINGGMSMNSWYDITGLGGSLRQDTTGVYRSAQYLQSLATVTAKKHSIDASRIVYAGFSQGCAISLIAGLSHTARTPPAGIVAMSGYFVSALSDKVRNKDVPISMHHGTHDDVVQFSESQRSKEEMEKLGVKNIEYFTYPMQHSAHPKEIERITVFLKKVLP